MAIVLIEATCATPLIASQLTAFVQGSQDCLKAHHIRWVSLYISPNGTRTLCEMEATDADTVREACSTAAVPFDHIWAADAIEYPQMKDTQGALLYPPLPLSNLATNPPSNSHPQGSVARILVSSLYIPPLIEAQVQEMKANLALHPCLEIRRIQKLRTLISGDRRRSICEFSATDADTLREAFRQENIPFERMWTAQLQTPELT